jgi:hypothetical protein
MLLSFARRSKIFILIYLCLDLDNAPSELGPSGVNQFDEPGDCLGRVVDAEEFHLLAVQNEALDAATNHWRNLK